MAVAHAQDTAGSSKAGLRKFGLTVGGAFALFGLVSYARGHTVAPRVLWTIAALLITPAVVAPAVLGPVQRVWMRGAMALGHVNSRVILTIFFYLVMTPIGVVMLLPAPCAGPSSRTSRVSLSARLPSRRSRALRCRNTRS